MNFSLSKIVIVSLIAGLLIAPATTKAQENMEINAPTPTPEFVKYDLAYPGILPDHPLYKLKVLRDKISFALISDPAKKIDLYLLKTDKEILATAMLIDKGKIDLAAQTALKAEHNFTLLTQEMHRLPKAPKEELYKKLNTASLKHQEVLASLVKRVPKEKQETFLTVIDFSKRNWKSVEEYKKSKEEQQMEMEKQEEAEDETEADK